MKPLLAAALAALALATGCNSDKPTDHGNGTPIPVGGGVVAKGDVAGTFSMVGGPYPGLARKLSGRIDIHSGSPTGRLEASVRTAKDGSFTASVPPGRYWLVGRSRHVTGVGCPGVHPVTIKPGTTAHVQVVCAVP
ncbi:MAG: hypothetical protein JO246_12060 [Frankiaceae bacterium]|nr:hypothetical protein [Frankiaceae bacterium]MBV9872410.1 hypothetical protein [Frankiaceae bacterium]